MSSKAYELLTQVKNLALIDDTSQDTIILSFMNNIQWQLYNAHYHWRALESYETTATTASQAYTTVPSNVGVIYDVRQTESSPYAKLRYVTPYKLNLVIPQPSEFSTDKPLYYTWWGGRLWFYPIPNDAYDLTIYYYKKPTNMKAYSTGTASVSGTALTGTSTYWSNNANVDTNMYFAFTADVRSDGTYPWAAITTVGGNTSITLTSAYTGSTSSGAYVISSANTFPEDFDLCVIYGSVIIMAGRVRELRETAQWLQTQYQQQVTFLAETQTSIPDQTSVVEDFSVDSANFPFTALLGQGYKYPFIRSDM